MTGEVTRDTRADEMVAAAFGPRATVIERRPFPYATSHPIDEVVVDVNGVPVHVLVKDLDGGALVDEARQIQPAFLVDGRREADVYRTALAGAGLGTATCYAAAGDVLALEKVAGVPLWQVGELEVWREAARWLARFHGARLHERAGADPSRLLRYDRRYYDAWQERLDTHWERRLAAVHGQVAEELLALPTTMIHGEFYPSNVLVAQVGDLRICPIDWEMAAIGPLAVDVAALTAGWDDVTAADLASCYREAGGMGESGPDFDRVLDLCRLHLCLRWLVWAPGWNPPPEHGRDWLGDALRIAGRLGM